MSWSGFKKSVARAGTTLAQKTGQVERTNDREFQSEEARFKGLEKNCLALHKESKAYLDGIKAMTSAQTRIGTTIDHFYGDSSDAAIAANSYKRAVDELDSMTSTQYDAPFRSTVLEPVGRLCSYFPEINNSISKRQKKLLDYDAARSKARKLGEKPSEDALKLQRAEKEEAEAKEIYDAFNDSLSTELPQMIDLRVPYLAPCFETMVRMQLLVSEQGYEKLASVQRFFAENVRDDYANGQLDAQVESALQDMRDLSICGSA